MKRSPSAGLELVSPGSKERPGSAAPQDERAAFAAHINACVQDARRLPLDAGGEDLFAKLRDGVLLCKLVNAAMPGTIDERVVNDKAGELSRFLMIENVQLALASARGIGCRIVNIGVDDVIEGRPNLLLGILWQLVRMQLLAGVDLVHVPELLVLLAEGETLAELLKLPAEKLLLRWVNHHLAAAGTALRIGNFGEHIKDCVAYDALLRQLQPEAADALEPLPAAAGEARAAAVLRNADRLLAGAARYARPADVLGGNAKLNLAFVASLFNARHGLVAPPRAQADSELAALLEFEDTGDGREARVLRYWANALGLEAACESIVDDAADGQFLLALLDKLAPGAVDWRRVAKPPFRLPFKRLENLNLAVELARGAPFHAVLVGVDGKDILDGHKKFALALLFQLMRFDQLRMLAGLSAAASPPRAGAASASPAAPSSLPSDAEILALANATVAASGKATRLASFRDAAFADGRFLLELLAAKGAGVNWELVSSEASDAAREANAKYVISVARKAGASVFNVWDDITTLKPKMLLTLTASILALKS